jgi:hypothetical protein
MKIINGTLVQTLGSLNVYAIEDNKFMVVGGTYDRLFETRPTITDLEMLQLKKPVRTLNNYQRWQLEKKCNVLVSKSRLHDNSNLFNSLLQNHIELSEFSTQGY